MSIISRMRKQTAVLWPLASGSGEVKYDDYGQPVTEDPVEIECRWEDKNEEFIDSAGTKRLSNALVYVDRDLEPGDVLMLGDLYDITDLDEPKENDGAFEVRRFDKIPNFRATEFLRTAYL